MSPTATLPWFTGLEWYSWSSSISVARFSSSFQPEWYVKLSQSSPKQPVEK